MTPVEDGLLRSLMESGGWFATGGNPDGHFILNSNGAFDSDPSISQTVSGLTPGAAYTVSGDYASVYSFAGSPEALSFAVDIDGVNAAKLGRPGGENEYGCFAVPFTAAGSSAVISFRAEIDGDDSSYRIDNIALTEGVLPPRLLNISTRLNVQTDDNVLIGGFIVTGNCPKKVIVRAIGPSLGGQGVAGALADPTLELNAPDGSVTSNDDWRESQQAEIEATGLQPTNDAESAILQTLAPGAYTAIVRGANGTTGVGLVEAYDLDQPADSKLANISTRGFVDTGDNVMIGGFIIGPDGFGDATVLVRAIGPSLENFGVANALQDPTLELFDGNGDTIMTNEDWRDTQDAEITATGLMPTDDRESAILQTLAPGNYTAIVRGALDTTGVGLVEVYDLQ